MAERKKALVTGAGRGVGYGIATELILAGYDVVLHYNSSAEGAEELKEFGRQQGVEAIPFQADLRDLDEIRRMFAWIDENFGGLDLFVNNSGITRMSYVLEPDEEMFDDVYKTNLRAAYFCVSQAGNNMVKFGKKGTIAIIGSNHCACVWANNSVYAMFKLALSKFTQHSAIEMAKYGIRVNLVAPGFVDNFRPVPEDKKEEAAARRKNIERTLIPLHRFIPRSEVGKIILFLASPAASSITGITLIADGGAHLLHGDPQMHNYWELEEEE